MASPPFKKNVQHVQSGEPGKASVVGRPDRQLEQNIAYLKDLIETAKLGKALFIYDVTVPSASAIGQPVYYDNKTGKYELARAATAHDSVTSTIYAADSSFVRGVIFKKHSTTLADLLVIGTAPLDISAAVDGTVENCQYYLSGADAGKLVRQRPAATVSVLQRYANGEVTVVPDVKDFVEDHIHFKFELYQNQAPTSASVGWLSADDAIFNSKAPSDAIWGYNISKHTELYRIWPPLPLDAAQLIWDRSDGKLGTVVPDGYGGVVEFTNEGIWWKTNINGLRPWDPYHKGSLSASWADGLDDVPSSLILYFIRMTFATDKSVVTSITSKKPDLLKITNADGNTASTGALDLDLDLGFITADASEEGYQAIKSLTVDNSACTQTFNRGPVVEGLFAGANTTLASSTQLVVGSDTLHMGRVTVNNSLDGAGREIPAELVRLDDVRERFTGIVMYLAFPAGQESGIDIKFKIPYIGLPTSPSVKIRALLVADSADAIPPLYLKKTTVPLGSLTTGAILPTSGAQTGVDFISGYTEATAANDSFLIESAAITVTAGDTLFCRIYRNGPSTTPTADSLPGEIGIVRIGAVIQ